MEPTMMKALRIALAPGTSTPALSLVSMRKPQLKSGYVLVKIHAAAINPSDALNAAGAFNTPLPRIPGRDFAGVVEDGPSELVGQEVYGTSGRVLSFQEDGSHAEFCLVPVGGIAPKPANLTFAQAATVGVPVTTASIALRRAQTTPADSILVLGATGAVGSAAAQLARARGSFVITASRRDSTDINLQKDFGLGKAKELTEGRGPDVVVDTVGDPALMRSALNVLARRGRISYIAAPRSGSSDFTFDVKSLYRNEHNLVGCNSVNYSPEELADDLRSMQAFFESGALKPSADSELVKIGLEEAVEAYAETSKRAGKKYVIQFLVGQQNSRPNPAL